MAKIRKQKIKVETKNIRTWKSIFNDWSAMMDKLYTNKDRNNALNWIENPADWMEPYNQYVFDAWIEYDSGSPFLNSRLTIMSKKRLIKDKFDVGDEFFVKTYSHASSGAGYNGAHGLILSRGENEDWSVLLNDEIKIEISENEMTKIYT